MWHVSIEFTTIQMMKTGFILLILFLIFFCSFCWCWQNCWPSLFKLSLCERWLLVLLMLVDLLTITYLSALVIRKLSAILHVHYIAISTTDLRSLIYVSYIHIDLPSTNDVINSPAHDKPTINLSTQNIQNDDDQATASVDSNNNQLEM